ncbi:4'-phosphopantetheinyl transferase family protein [Candidatus Bipolaricaulota bacterium]
MHIWTAHLGAIPSTASVFAVVASEEERQRAGSIRVESVRERYVAARIFFRTTLSLYSDAEASDIVFEQGPHGKPSIAGSELEFNLTHSADLALLALCCGRRVGIDVERISPMPCALDIARRFFSADEYTELASFPPDLQSAAFYATWTRKEAFLKGLGVGIPNHLGQFTVQTSPCLPAALLRVEWQPDLSKQWELRDLHVESGYCGCLAVEEHLMSVRHFSWSLESCQRASRIAPWGQIHSADA